MLRWIILFFLFFGVFIYGQDIHSELVNEVTQNTLLWTVFCVSILYFIYSSIQIRRLKKENKNMKEKYNFLEKNQHDLLANMGENIHNIAKQTFEQTSQLAEKTKKSILHSEIQDVMHNENELLGATSDLIQFIQLKSKKTTIHNEICNFNHILNETIGLLSETTQRNNTELIFDVSNNTPNSIMTDSSQLVQILVNLLEYCIQHSKTNKVHLLIDTKSNENQETNLLINIEGNIKINNKSNFFDTNYNDKSREYIGLGLFIAKELVDLMEGKLSIIEGHNSDNLHIKIPLKQVNKNSNIYTLDNNLSHKKTLIVDTDNDAAIALEKRLSYFNIDTNIKSQEVFNNNLPNFTMYDIIILNKTLLTPKIINILLLAKQKHTFKIISIAHLYDASTYTPHEIVDLIIYKPFSPEYIFELLQNLNNPNINKKETTLAIHKEPFVEVYGIELEDFSQFSSKHLLLVEDNFINQKLISSVLSKSNLNIEIACNGQEALTYLEHNPTSIDFILMDINMPVMDGFTATEHIRKQDKFDHIPIVALTALVADYEIVKMFSIGMNGYLSKPISIGKLYSAFNTYLDNHDEPEDIHTQNNLNSTKLEGLNTKDGLESMHNNITLYKEVLREFIGAYEKSDIVLDLLIKNNRYSEAQKLCLDIKGLADTIGAKEISILCNEIYNQLVYEKYNKLEKYSQTYTSLLGILKKSIQTYLKN